MKIAIVTGASSGLGKEFARQISKKYQMIDEIWIIARREDRLRELSRQLKKKVRILPLDLDTDSDIRILADALVADRPDVKMLVNCAGYGKTGSFELGSYEDETGMVTTNCRALTAVTYLVLPYMKESSRIINIASVAAFLPQPQFAVYAASKAYVLSFTRALRCELRKRRIHVTAVCPGPVSTEFFDIADPDGDSTWYKKFFMAKAPAVVLKAMRDSAADKELSVYGLPMKAVHLLSKIIPHKIILKMLYGK